MMNKWKITAGLGDTSAESVQLWQLETWLGDKRTKQNKFCGQTLLTALSFPAGGALHLVNHPLDESDFSRHFSLQMLRESKQNWRHLRVNNNPNSPSVDNVCLAVHSNSSCWTSLTGRDKCHHMAGRDNPSTTTDYLLMLHTEVLHQLKRECLLRPPEHCEPQVF